MKQYICFFLAFVMFSTDMLLSTLATSLLRQPTHSVVRWHLLNNNAISDE
jgi:hypothetical protein